MMAWRSKPPLELAARALCRFHGLPEDTMFERKPMWHSYLDEATAVLRAALSDDDFKRLVTDQPIGKRPGTGN